MENIAIRLSQMLSRKGVITPQENRDLVQAERERLEGELVRQKEFNDQLQQRIAWIECKLDMEGNYIKEQVERG